MPTKPISVMRPLFVALGLAGAIGCAAEGGLPRASGAAPDAAKVAAVGALDSALLPRIALDDSIVRPEVATLAALQAQFGGSLWRDPTSESGDTRLCFVGSADARPASIIFGANSMGGPMRTLAFIEVDRDVRSSEYGLTCPLLGAPEGRGGDTLTFRWMRKQFGPYRTIREQKDTVVEWDVSTHIRAITSENRVRALRLSHSTTYQARGGITTLAADKRRCGGVCGADNGEPT